MDTVQQLSLLSPEDDLLLILGAWLSAGWGQQSRQIITHNIRGSALIDTILSASGYWSIKHNEIIILISNISVCTLLKEKIHICQNIVHKIKMPHPQLFLIFIKYVV